MKDGLFLACLAWLAAAGMATAQTVIVRNPTGRHYPDELVRLQCDAPAGAFAVETDGQAVPHQVEQIGSRRWAWVCVSMPAESSRAFRIVPGRAGAKAAARVKLLSGGGFHELDNGLLAVRVPAGAASPGEVPGPIAGVRLPGGKWLGRSSWHTARKCTRLTATVVGDGMLFAKVRLRYEFEGKAGLGGDVGAFAEVDVSLSPGHRHAAVEERHEMDRGDWWELDAAAGWAPRQASCQIHGGGPSSGADPSSWPRTLQVGQTRMGDTLLNLMPRWTQAFDDGWFFLTTDGAAGVGAIAARAGRWYWPHDNLIAVKVKPSGDYAGLRCPTFRGRRWWMLLAGPAATWGDIQVPDKDPRRKERTVSGARDYVERHAFQPLDKLNSDYILDWPGLTAAKPGGFAGEFFFSSHVNPTGGWRGRGRSAIRDAGRGPANLSTLTQVQVQFDADMYGTYWLFWSPENPNFFTDFIKVPLGLGTNLRGHPRFAEIARLAELKLHEDLYHSVTLPGGAGNECPGYLHHAMGSWRELAKMCREFYGFDATAWPRYKAAGSFIAHVSVPDGGGRRVFHPGGDTHPGRPDPLAVAREFGCEPDPKTWKTEELPGFGVILRNRCGAGRETYLAFKSGPNRGHYHGDQLSFHLCFNAHPVAVDHHCSYRPRAGQEHMHNRLAFSSERLQYANMDGYERLIALKNSPVADAAVGQVESGRIRSVNKLPPEHWDSEHPQERFDKPLKYRRTIVLVKDGPAGQDYFVVRDQYAGPRLTATYCLHTYGDVCRRQGARVDLGALSLFVAAPADFAFDNLPWSHDNGGAESTQGPRLSVTGETAEFITVLHPPGPTPPMSPIPGGAKVGPDEITFAGPIDHEDDTTYVTVRRAGAVALTLTGRDIDLNRSQGEVGLFVPDAGYPFGDIPDWLIRQRAAVPDWAKDYVHKLLNP